MKPYLKLFDLSSDHEDEVSHLIKGILVEKGVVLVVGAYGTGKTQAVMRMASSIATGAVFGHGKANAEDANFDFCYPKKLGYTLYFAGEGKANVKGRIKAAQLALSDNEKNFLEKTHRGKMPIVPIRVENPLNGANHIEEIDALIWEAKIDIPTLEGNPSLIIFDTLSSVFLIKDENNNSEMQKVFRALESYAEHYNCCVVVVAHPPKSHDAQKGYSRGASAISNSADVILYLSKMNGSSHRKMRVLKMRDGQYQDSIVKFKIQNYGSSPAFVTLDATEDAQTEKNTQAKGLSDRQKDIIRILQVNDEMFQKDIITALLSGIPDGKKPSTEKRLARRDIQELVDLGHVITEKIGKNVFVKIKELLPIDVDDSNGNEEFLQDTDEHENSEADENYSDE